MSGGIEVSAKPLPVVLKAARDELLSSWLARHARFYGVTGPFFAKWLGLGDIRLTTLDHRLGLTQLARLTEKFHCDPTTLIGMTHIDKRDGRVGDLIGRGRRSSMTRRSSHPCRGGKDRPRHALLAEAWEPLQRRDCAALRGLTGVAPVTKRSGKSCIVVRRQACHERLANALYHWARVASQDDPRSRVKSQRFAGGSGLRPSVPAPPFGLSNVDELDRHAGLS